MNPQRASRFASVLAAVALLLPPFAGAAEPEVDAGEYRVYADFLNGRPADLSAYPQDFGDVWRARAVARRTGVRRELDAGALRAIHRELGEIAPEMLEDYRARNSVPASVPQRLREHGMRVVAEEPELPGELTGPRGLALGVGTLQFSRVGFDATKQRALLHVFLVGGGPSLGYFVSMSRVDGKWVVRKAALTDYLIH